MSIRSFHRAQARRVDRAARRANLLARRGRLLAGATLGATTLLAANAQAATWVVNTTADSSDPGCAPSPGVCSLRDAISAANSSGTRDTITFDPSVTGQINLGSELDITTSQGMEINGPGAGTLTISGQGSTGIFKLTGSGPPGGNVSNVISGLTLTDGATSDPGGAVSDQTYQPLVLVHDVISNSTSTNTDSNGGGGGVFAAGPAEIVASTISGNSALHGGGVEINPKYNSGPTPKYAQPLLVQSSTITGNHATGTSSVGPGPFGGGGGIAAYGSELVVRKSTLTGNTSAQSGGAITDISKYGLTLSGSKLTGNTAAFNGGGIMDRGWIAGRKYDPTEISSSTISGNSAHAGGGLAVIQSTFGYSGTSSSPGQSITIDSSTISGNHGTNAPTSSTNPNSFGGGIEVFGSLESPFRLVNSTVSGNTAGRGGGLSLGGEYYQPLVKTDPLTGQRGSVTLENSTIAGNNAKQPFSGGGIYLGRYHTGSGPSKQAGTAAIESTIVSGNKSNGKPNDLRRAGGATTGGFTGEYSLIQHPGAAPLTGSHLILSRKPGLGPLQDNGGPTQTKLPWSKSPVIDQGHGSLEDATDQRGKPRTVDTGVANPSGGDGTDIGAVELSTGQVVVPKQTGFSADVGTRRLGGASTPLLVDGVTPVSCRVTAGPLGACQLQVTVDGLPVASGGVPAQGSARRLTTTVNSSLAAQRYLLSHYPLGLVANARAVGLASGPAAALGRVRLLGGPSITLPLGTGTTRFSAKVGRELDQAARLLAGARKVRLSSNSRTQAAAIARRLTHDGVRGQIQIHVSRHVRGHRITISFSY